MDGTLANALILKARVLSSSVSEEDMGDIYKVWYWLVVCNEITSELIDENDGAGELLPSQPETCIR